MSCDLTADYVRSILDYDPETGIFRWHAGYARSVVGGRVAGRVNGKGYGTISIKNKHYSSHRLAWLHFYGEWPSSELDHINRNKCDNRIANLRAVTASQNCQNRHQPKSHYSGERGVSFLKNRNKWQVQICLPGQRKPKYVGCYASKEVAVAAYASAKRDMA